MYKEYHATGIVDFFIMAPDHDCVIAGMGESHSFFP